MNADRPRSPRHVRRPLLLLAPLLVALPLYAGCKGVDTEADDPLVNGKRIGNDVPPPPKPVADPREAPVAPPVQNPTPPAPSVTPAQMSGATGTTPAALTANTGGTPADPRSDPRYNGPATAAASPESNGWRTAPASTGTATLGTVEPVADGSRSPTPASTVSAPGVITRVGGVQGGIETVEQADALLKSYGVWWDRLERVGSTEDYYYECSVLNTQTNIGQTYKARGHGRVGAMRAVIDEIAKGRGGN